MTTKVRVEVTDAEGIRTTLENECDLRIYVHRQIVVRDVSSFLERTLPVCAGRNLIKVRVEVTNEKGARTKMEKEGYLHHNGLRKLTITDVSRFIENFYDDDAEFSCMSEQLYACILGAIKDVFYEKGYTLLRSRRSPDTGIFLFNRT